jgi:hypothetical protein
MAGLNTIEQNEVLTVRTYKIVPNANIAWANTYEIMATETITDPDEVANELQTLKTIFTNCERGLLNAAYILDRIVISTYVPDGQPYNPYTFSSFSVNLPGEYVTPGNPLLPLQFCTLVKRVVPFGRQGNILYRGIVAANNANVTSAGTIIDSSRVSQITNVLQEFKNALTTNGWRLVMVTGRETVDYSTLRIVLDLNVKSDMRFKKLNNRYFDKERDSNG